MANQTSKFLIAVIGAGVLGFANPARAQEDVTDPYYNGASRSDFIALNAGDAPQANIAIQTPTPWPYYINDTDIPMDGTPGVDLIRKFLNRHAAEPPPPGPSITINAGPVAGAQ